MNFKSFGFLSIILITTVCILSSCQFNVSEASLPIHFNTNEMHTLIFSSNKNQDQERFYYDAILKLKKKYPEKLRSIKIITENEDNLVNYYHISTYPTIIVLNGKKESVRLEGKEKVDDIKNRLEKAYTQ